VRGAVACARPVHGTVLPRCAGRRSIGDRDGRCDGREYFVLSFSPNHFSGGAGAGAGEYVKGALGADLLKKRFLFSVYRPQL
jgi:hypothetical protein